MTSWPYAIDGNAFLAPTAAFLELAARALARDARGPPECLPAPATASPILAVSPEFIFGPPNLRQPDDNDGGAVGTPLGGYYYADVHDEVLAPGSHAPPLPPMIFQLLVGRFVRHIGNSEKASQREPSTASFAADDASAGGGMARTSSTSSFYGEGMGSRQGSAIAGGAALRFPVGLTALHDGNLAVCSGENDLLVVTQECRLVKRLTGIGGLRFPRGLAALGGQFLAIADGGSHAIIVCDYSTGAIVKRLGNRQGNPGDRPEEFNNPAGIAVLRGGDVLAVCDQANHRVKVVEWRTGVVITMIGSGRRGKGPNDFNAPWGITYVPMHNVLCVCDQDNHRIAVVTPDGALVRHIGAAANGGKGVDDFARPRGVVGLASGNLAISDICNHRVKVVTIEGVFVRQFRRVNGPFRLCGDGSALPPSVVQADVDAPFFPLGITVLPDGDVAVGDRDNHRISVFRP